MRTEFDLRRLEPLRLRRDALRTGEHPVQGPWVEAVWLPVVGPTALLALRRFDRLVARDGEATMATSDLAHWFGVSVATARRGVERLVQFGVLRPGDDLALLVPAAMPPPADRVLDRLPPALASYARQ